jgi:hypothetical protein
VAEFDESSRLGVDGGVKECAHVRARHQLVVERRECEQRALYGCNAVDVAPRVLAKEFERRKQRENGANHVGNRRERVLDNERAHALGPLLAKRNGDGSAKRPSKDNNAPPIEAKTTAVGLVARPKAPSNSERFAISSRRSVSDSLHCLRCHERTKEELAVYLYLLKTHYYHCYCYESEVTQILGTSKAMISSVRCRRCKSPPDGDSCRARMHSRRKIELHLRSPSNSGSRASVVEIDRAKTIQCQKSKDLQIALSNRLL